MNNCRFYPLIDGKKEEMDFDRFRAWLHAGGLEKMLPDYRLPGKISRAKETAPAAEEEEANPFVSVEAPKESRATAVKEPSLADELNKFDAESRQRAESPAKPANHTQRAALRRSGDEADLAEHGIEPLGPKGEYGQTSFHLRRAMLGRDSSLLDSFGRGFGLDLDQKDRANSVNAVMDHLASLGGKSRSSNLSPEDYDGILKNHADRLPDDAIDALVAAMNHQTEWFADRNAFTDALTPILEKIDYNSVKSLKDVPISLRREIFDLSKKYEKLGQTAVKNAFDEAFRNFQRRTEESAARAESRADQGAIQKNSEGETQKESGADRRLPGESGIAFAKASPDDAFYPPDFYEHEASWFRAVDNFVKDGDWAQPKRVLGHTPQVLIKLGFTDRLITITPSIIAKAMRDHDLSPAIMKQIPRQIASPVMVFESAKQNGSKVVVTSLFDNRGRPVTVVLMPDGKIEHIDVNPILSAYGRNDKADFKRWFEKGLLRYANKEKSRKWFQSAGLQLPIEKTVASGTSRILNEQDIVKKSGPQMAAAKDKAESIESKRFDADAARAFEALDRLAKARVRDLARNATFSVADGLFTANPEGMTLFRLAIMKVQGEDPSMFYGFYADPERKELIGRELDRFAGELARLSPPLGRRMAKFSEAWNGAGSDAAAVLGGFGRVTKYATQEELLHRADFRVRNHTNRSLKPYVALDSYNKAFQNLKEGAYRDGSAYTIHNEIIGKLGRDDAAEELGISWNEVDEIEALHHEQLAKHEVSPEDYRERYQDISERADKGIEKYERISGKLDARNGENDAITGGSDGAFDEGSGAVGPGSSETRADSTSRNSDFLPAVRRGGVLDGSGKSTEIAFAKATATRKILDALDKTLAKSTNLSPTRALENVVNKNLQQLRHADEDAYNAVLKLAGEQAQLTAHLLTGLDPSQTTAAGKTPQEIAEAIHARNLVDTVNALQVAGLIVPVTKSAPTPTAIGGKTAGVMRIAGVPYAAPLWLKKELTPVFEGTPDPNAVQKVVRVLNRVGAAGIFDAVFHSANVIGSVIGTTPYVGKDIASRTIGNTPATKWLTTLLHLAFTNPEKVDPAILREMADAGVIPARYGRETYSKKLAARLGAHRKMTSLGPAISGPKGLDIRARIVMWKIGKHINPKASNSEMADFVNQLGIYSRAMESQLSRSLKRSDIAPFFTAGSQMWKNGVLMWLGKTPMPNEDLPLANRIAARLQQQFGAGVLGLVAMWIALSLLYRQKLPWDDKDSRFMQIPLNDDDRKSDLAKKIFGDNEKTAYVGLGFFSPLVERGGRALGLTGIYDTAVLGGTKTQMAEEGEKDAINSLLHPITTGPAVHAGFIGLTGREPQIKAMRESNGEFGATFWKAELPKGAGAGRSLLEGALELNPMAGDILHNLGVNRDQKDKPTEGEANVYLRSVMDMSFPRLFKGPVDRDKARARMADDTPPAGAGVGPAIRRGLKRKK